MKACFGGEGCALNRKIADLAASLIMTDGRSDAKAKGDLKSRGLSSGTESGPGVARKQRARKLPKRLAERAHVRKSGSPSRFESNPCIGLYNYLYQHQY